MQFHKLPNGQMVYAMNQSDQRTPLLKNVRSLTPTGLNKPTDATPSSNARLTQNRSISPIGSENLPGDKYFVEKTTGETLLVTPYGTYASKSTEDRYIKLNYTEQILYGPFE